jgi:hypothetical protein
MNRQRSGDEDLKTNDAPAARSPAIMHDLAGEKLIRRQMRRKAPRLLKDT